MLRRLGDVLAPRAGSSAKFNAAMCSLVNAYRKGLTVDFSACIAALPNSESTSSPQVCFDAIAPSLVHSEFINLTGDRFYFGGQHDAAECLSEILFRTGLAASAFNFGDHSSEDIVLALPEFSDIFLLLLYA